MKRDKVLTIQVDEYIRRRVEEIVEACKDYGITKSDVGYIILSRFFAALPPNEDVEAIRDVVPEYRRRGLI